MLELKNNIDVSIYAKTKYDHEQMEQIWHALRKNLDFSKYSFLKQSAKEMKEIYQIMLEEKRKKDRKAELLKELSELA